MQGRYSLLTIVLISFFSANLHANSSLDKQKMREDMVHVRNWNKFADRLVQLHMLQISNRSVSQTERIGGYKGNEKFYRELVYTDKNTGKVVSKIQWEREHPERVHMVEVNVFDENNNIIRDYLAAYLPLHRNAPIQTIINLHAYKDNLHAFRQFDASGEKIYEYCGENLGEEKVRLSLLEDDLTDNNPVYDTELYKKCFDSIPESSSQFSNPLIDAPLAKTYAIKLSPLNVTPDVEAVQIERYIKDLNEKIMANSNNDGLYIERGTAYFILHNFDEAIADYSQAMRVNPENAMAYFGRGLVLGRIGHIKDGINDIGVYIKKNPASSMAYTKRGVRYIWLGDLENAEKDLSKAVELDKHNAEARDDLGVIYAQRGEMEKAIQLFTTTIRIDPRYLKGHHNLAMALYMNGKRDKALISIDNALLLNPNEKNSLMLKSEILDALGRSEEAEKIRSVAEFLPDGNWSEQYSTQ